MKVQGRLCLNGDFLPDTFFVFARHSDYRDIRRGYNSSPPPVSYGRRAEPGPMFHSSMLDSEDYRGGRDWPRRSSGGDRDRRGGLRENERGGGEPSRKLFVKNVRIVSLSVCSCTN